MLQSVQGEQLGRKRRIATKSHECAGESLRICTIRFLECGSFEQYVHKATSWRLRADIASIASHHTVSWLRLFRLGLNVDGDRTDLDECSGAANVSFVDATPCRQLFISSAVRGC
ncbi:hypothetical protein NECAME_04299 [Necator americanus]|uniref:Uncharacterized protein n=1 Tax=Necator americanus TaxID=51031 RepID=W2SWW5_NECAM|nr:hypothetical protein NECAME_04299 [Necator americanus]ETN73301.1 hypothetical protein NECAME_04299 [Necator americanus]